MTSFGAERLVGNFRRRLGATPHLWGFIGIVYAFVALFALVVVLDVTHH